MLRGNVGSIDYGSGGAAVIIPIAGLFLVLGNKSF
jgi:hypothetical protein